MSLSPPRDLTRAHGPVSRRWAGVRVSQMAPVSAHLSSDASAQSITYYSTRTHGYKRCRGEYEVIDRHLAEKKKKRNLLSLNFQSSVESVGRHELQSVSPYGEHKSVRMSWLHATCSSLTLFFFFWWWMLFCGDDDEDGGRWLSWVWDRFLTSLLSKAPRERTKQATGRSKTVVIHMMHWIYTNPECCLTAKKLQCLMLRQDGITEKGGERGINIQREGVRFLISSPIQ